jgi:hypothetical protein
MQQGETSTMIRAVVDEQLVMVPVGDVELAAT